VKRVHLTKLFALVLACGRLCAGGVTAPVPNRLAVASMEVEFPPLLDRLLDELAAAWPSVEDFLEREQRDLHEAVRLAFRVEANFDWYAEEFGVDEEPGDYTLDYRLLYDENDPRSPEAVRRVNDGELDKIVSRLTPADHEVHLRVCYAVTAPLREPVTGKRCPRRDTDLTLPDLSDLTSDRDVPLVERDGYMLTPIEVPFYEALRETGLKPSKKAADVGRNNQGEQGQPARSTRSRTRRVLRTLPALAGFAALVFSLFAAYVAWEWIAAPGIDDLRPASAEATFLVARGERPPGTPPPLHIPIAWEEMPVSLRNATVAIEDQRFYEHGALDHRGVLRAALTNLFSGKTLEGGSTITQQLARTLYIRNPNRSLARKIRETKLAMQLEARHSKQWILREYLNSIPYGAVNGRVVIGVEAAAEAFFSTSAKRLGLAEAALIAGLPQAPTVYDPFKHPDAARARRAQVLKKMVALGFSSRRAAARASLAPVALSDCGSPIGPEDLRPVSSLALGPSGASRHSPDRRLDRRLERFMRGAGPLSGAYVFDATTRKPLFQWRARVPRTLASNTKLFTAAAVLDRLRPLRKIHTRILGTGSLGHGIWRGNLYLRGSGDPAFGAEVGRVEIKSLVRQLRRRGIKGVRGKVLGDGSLFDSRKGGPDSGWRTSIFVGPLSALSFNRGRSLHAEAAFQTHPVLATARILRAELEKRGIRVSGPAATGAAPAGASRIAAVSSRRIEELVRKMVKWSDSFDAEILLKGLAARVSHRAGSTTVGAREASRFARSLGVRVHLRDGSGLCRKNKASPREVVRLLDRVRHRRNFPAFFLSLPVAGRDGTLYDRMRSTPARDRCSAKTATLSDVSNLSGYCRTQRGHTIIFSLMMDRVDVQSAHRLQDQMVASITCHEAKARASNTTAGLFRPLLFAGGRKRRMVALTFDDGPGRYTPEIISTLRRMHAGATFFQVGYALSAGQPIGPEERNHDMTIGTHTATHSDLGLLPASAQIKEILAGAHAITSHGAPFPRLFRPPYDSFNAATLDVLRRLRMRMVLQTADTQDWLRKRRAIVRRALAGARPGGIILMHDGGGDRSETVAALPSIITGLHKRGYRVVSVPTLLRRDPPPLERPVPFSACRRLLVPKGRTHLSVTKGPLTGPWSWRAMLRIPLSGG
jgi:serine-type D-Ala-D-Ala carboxypeptidase/endopeptidase (penicillin-binding protein 4)